MVLFNPQAMEEAGSEPVKLALSWADPPGQIEVSLDAITVLVLLIYAFTVALLEQPGSVGSLMLTE